VGDIVISSNDRLMRQVFYVMKIMQNKGLNELSSYIKIKIL